MKKKMQEYEKLEYNKKGTWFEKGQDMKKKGYMIGKKVQGFEKERYKDIKRKVKDYEKKVKEYKKEKVIGYEK